MNLRHLTDTTLHQDLVDLSHQERVLSQKILLHIQECDHRRLYSALGYQSPFDYLCRGLHYSEGAANRRITAARLMTHHPEIGDQVESGEVTLGQLVLVGSLFRQEDFKGQYDKQKKILQEVKGKTQQQTQTFVQKMKGKNPGKTIVLSQETLELIEELKSLSATTHSDEKILQMALKELIRLKKKKQVPIKESPKTYSRYIPAQVKKIVFQRDGGKCRHCGVNKRLQYDHVTPFALGGETSVENLRLLCVGCNQRKAMEAGFTQPVRVFY